MTQESATANPFPAWTMLLWLCLGGLLVFRLAALAFNQTDLMFDEAQYWSWSREPAFGYFSKPPVVAWVIRLATAVCGHGEVCIRAAAPVLYTLAAAFIFLTARALYDAHTGFWAALVFATVPGVSFSSGLISTDVPLILFWCMALYFWVRLTERREWRDAIGLGIAVGLGLLSKYAMVYFLVCAGLWLLLERDARWLAASAKGWAALALAAALLAPNVAWNVENGLVTFVHTAANANWGGELLRIAPGLQFLAAQFGVFGPVLMGVLLLALWQALIYKTLRATRMLLMFSVPVIALVLAQAFVSRAHANWAATAYPAAAILVTAVMLRQNWRRLFRASLILHLGAMAALAAANAAAPDLKLPLERNPYARLLGWRETAEATRAQLGARPYAAILCEDRWLTAELLYYLRDSDVPLRAWRPHDMPRDHFELTRKFRGADGPVLLVTRRGDVTYVTGRFEQAEPLGQTRIATGPDSSRTVRFFALDGYRDRRP